MESIEAKRQQNELKFGNWKNLASGGRRYWYEIPGRDGWKAKYIKEVNSEETTVLFCQEIYDSQEKLVEIHQKYPVDLGHQKVR